MISPEVLRRYAFFSCLDEKARGSVAMIAEDVKFAASASIDGEGAAANWLFLLTEGSVALSVTVGQQQLVVQEINGGEPFGLCATLDGETYTTTARANGPCRCVKIDAVALRQLLATDSKLETCLLRQVAQSGISQVRALHIELAAARA